MLFLRDTPSEVRRSTIFLVKEEAVPKWSTCGQSSFEDGIKGAAHQSISRSGPDEDWTSSNLEKPTWLQKSGKGHQNSKILKSKFWNLEQTQQKCDSRNFNFYTSNTTQFFVSLSMSLDTAYTMMMNDRIMMMKAKGRSNQVDKGQNCDQTPFLILRFLRLAISQFLHRLSHILHLDNLDSRAWC